MEISKTHSWKSQQDTEPTLLLRAGGENRDVFHNCKNLGTDYYVNIIIIILISSFPSVRCCLEQCFFPINIASLSLCKSHAASPTQGFSNPGKQGKAKKPHHFFIVFYSNFTMSYSTYEPQVQSEWKLCYSTYLNKILQYINLQLLYITGSIKKLNFKVKVSLFIPWFNNKIWVRVEDKMSNLRI